MIKNFLNLLKYKIQTNQKKFIIKSNKQIHILIKKLIELHIILQITKIDKNKFLIELNFSVLKAINFNINLFLKNSNKQPITFVFLKKLIKRHLIMLLLTNKGILTSKECLYHNISGIPLLYFKII